MRDKIDWVEFNDVEFAKSCRVVEMIDVSNMCYKVVNGVITN